MVLMVLQHMILDFGLLGVHYHHLSVDYYNCLLEDNYHYLLKDNTTNRKRSPTTIAYRCILSTCRKPTTISNLGWSALLFIICFSNKKNSWHPRIAFFWKNHHFHLKAPYDLLQSQLVQLPKLDLVMLKC